MALQKSFSENLKPPYAILPQLGAGARTIPQYYREIPN